MHSLQGAYATFTGISYRSDTAAPICERHDVAKRRTISGLQGWRGTFRTKTIPPALQSYHHAVAAVKNVADESASSPAHFSIPNELQQVAVGVADVVADAGGRPAVSAPDALYRSFDHLRAGRGKRFQ